MIVCPRCNERVPYALLRVDYPRCSKGHELGVWVMCGNEKERHIYLRNGDMRCVVCGDPRWERISVGTPVKCMHRTSDGKPCLFPEYVWMVDGPPCHMNHLSIIVVDEEKIRGR